MGVFDNYICDYRLCTQTVTVYHEENGDVARREFSKAYLDFKKTETTEKTGQQEANGFLLVIPGPEQAVYVGDKVYLGKGPNVPDDIQKWWRTFIPAKVPGLVVVKYVDCKYFGGAMVHTEAGG